MAVILGDRTAGGRTIEKPESASAISHPVVPFADLLRRYRDAAELTQEALAERAGLSVRAISDLERGIKLRPQRTTIRLLAEGLGLTAVERAGLEAAVPSRHRPVEEGLRLLDLPVGGFLGAAPESPLVARSREVARIRDLVDVVRLEGGRLLLLSGEPGAGKTRLAQEATLICRASGMYLTTGRCYQTQRHVPFAPFLEVVARVVSVAQDRLSLDPLQRWPQLARLIPGHHLPNATDEGDQQQLFWAVSGLLETLAQQIPVAIAIDDLHWADRSSLLLLQHLAPQIRRRPVVVLGTYRDVEVEPDGSLGRLLRDLHRERLAEEIDVQRLSRDETRELIGATLGGGDVAADLAHVVHRHTEGNAFFVQEVARALTERGDVVDHGGIWEYRATSEIAVPHTVQEAIQERLNRLSPPAQSLLKSASVLGQTFTFDEICGMAGQTEEAIEELLAEATHASVIKVADRDGYTFNHALTQWVLYREQPPRQRKRLHLAAGTAIAGQSKDPPNERTAELAWHFLEAGAGDLALRYAVLAGDQADRRYAHAEAEQQYRTALDLSRGRGETDLEARLLEKLGRVFTNVARSEEAQTSLERAVDLYRQLGDQEGEIRGTVQLGSVHRATGTADAGAARVRKLLDRLEPGTRAESEAELWIVLETLEYVRGRYEEGLAAAERAAELARTVGAKVALARAETGRGTELMLLGRLDQGLSAMEGAILLGEEADDPYNLVRTLDNAADGYRARGELQRSRDLVEQSLALQKRLSTPWGVALASSACATTYRLLGEWTRAHEHLTVAEQLRHTLPPSWWAFYGLLELGELSLEEGKLEQSSRVLNDALTLARESGHVEGICATECVLAELDLVQAEPAKARGRLKPLFALATSRVQVMKLLPTLAAAHEASGELGPAEEVIEEGIRRARELNHILTLTSALLVRGRLMAARADWSAAERDLEEAIQLARAMGNPLLEARGLFQRGSMFVKRSQVETACQLLRQAHAIFHRLGAGPDAERTERLLAAQPR